VVLTLVWGLMLFPASINRVFFWTTLVLTAVLFCMFVTSSVLSGLVRKRLRLEVGHFGVQPQQELANQVQQGRVHMHSADVEAPNAPGSRAAAVL
jgi:hypothetical protein